MSAHAKVESPPRPANSDPLAVVLLVDDQPFVAELLQRLTAAESDLVFEYCRDPTEALEAARRVRPSVILLDIVMPTIDGLTLCRFMRADPVTRTVPIIMLSSNEDTVTKAEAFASGANDYLVKLPDKIELVARLRYHSRAYRSRLERDEAYRALSESQSQLETLNQRLLELANQDGLTGLANRRVFDERFLEEWGRASRHLRPLSHIMIDVDHFKAFNDRYGHLAGDECLQRIAPALKANVGRTADLVARYGGEEFVVILPETTADGAWGVAEAMRSAVWSLAIPHEASSAETRVTVSLGVACATPFPSGNPEVLLVAADQCLYEAKSGGRNRVHSVEVAGEALRTPGD